MRMIKDKIAVIGMASLFPGSESPEAFFQQLLDKQHGKSRATATQMQVDPEPYLGKAGDTDKYYCLQGGFINDAAFEAEGFRMPADRLASLDDLFKWSLTVSREALKRAGYWQSTALESCGVLLGNLSFPTKQSNHLFLPLYRQALEAALAQQSVDISLSDFAPVKAVDTADGYIAGLPSGVIANACGLGGSHFSLDAACASSCYAIQMACHYLQTGKSNMMLAGAVSAADPMFVHMGFSIFHAFPENQIHAPFDQQSDGLFAGEGAGMLVLKRYTDAVADNDQIYAVIEGGGLSNDGKGEFVLSPNKKGQVLAYQRAYQEADIDPVTVDYVECHATGTPKGDKVELASLEAFFMDSGAKPWLGSVKSNLGHLLTAAGMAGVIKTIKALNEKVIPATINVNQAITSPKGYFSQTGIVTDTLNWPETAEPPTAAVSVFGFGGSNAHLVFREAASNTVAKQPLHKKEPMMIVGMDAHFGAQASLSAFTDLVVSDKTTLTSLPKNRWQGFEKFPQLLQAVGLKQPPMGGFIDQFSVDFLRFKIPPNDDDCLIPQQLLMMKVADNAAQRAGLTEGSNVAVLVAMGVEPALHQYRGRVNLQTQITDSLHREGMELSAQEQQQLTDCLKDSLAGAAGLNQYTSFIGNIMASRISALWDFSGPALTVSAEENSVFSALELADTLFQTTDVEAVIVAAVDLAGSYENLYLRSQSLPVATAVTTDPFQQTGFIPGEGAGAIVLKPASRVDHKGYAQIDGLGASQGLTEHDLISAGQKALQQARQATEAIDLVEAFIQGDATQNQIEKSALMQLYPKARVACIKQNIGHTCHASGMASIISSAIKLNEGLARTIAISSLGIDETCTHSILSAVPHSANVLPLRNNKQRLDKIIQPGGAILADEIARRLPESLSQRLQKHRQPDCESAQVIHMQAKGATVMPKDSPTPPPIKSGVTALQQQLMATHNTFLEVRLAAQREIDAMMTALLVTDTQSVCDPMDVQKPLAVAACNESAIHLPIRFSQPANIIFDQADLVEFAEGDIGRVFGPAYSQIDTYRRRVRLPTSDYLLVTRVTDLDAALHAYKPSSMATEYDIPTDAPFLVDGQIPWSVSVESGQCDLMLISYIGIDFQAKGERVYRLLDCELTFLEDMAFGGQTLRYEIHIDSYAKNGDQLLFFFHYDCYVEGKKVLIMRGGCAGFFTDDELAGGKGVILTDEDKAQLKNAEPTRFEPLIANQQYQYGIKDMMRLVRGDIAGCFGSAYDQGGRNPSLRFSSEKFLMIEKISHIDPDGGHWGLGVLYGHKRLEPDHWYFPCHFKDDQVMAGSLMSEGCGQLAMFYMLWLGMHTRVNNARFQPVPGASQKVRCRGQVTPQSNQLTYRMEVTSIRMTPHPELTANIDIILDDKVVVDFKNLAVMIREQAPESPYARLVDAQIPVMSKLAPEQDETGRTPFADVNSPLMWIETDREAAMVKGVKPIRHRPAPEATEPHRQNRQPDTLPFTPWHLFEFATGDIAKCFGPEFSVYRNRIPPRTPCGDLQLVTEVISIEGQRHALKQASACVAHYEVPADAWYYQNNAHPADMPYSLLMEIALQPNGFLSGYMGTTLSYPDKDLFFRNLDGKGHLLKALDLRGKTVKNHSRLLSTSMAGGSIIQSFTFELSVAGECFYKGTAVFGYFSKSALTNQLGIDNGELCQPWFADKPKLKRQTIALTDPELSLFKAQAGMPYYRLLQGQLNFIDSVTWVDGGGDYGLGYLYAERQIDASDWFFRYHFHQDPVMPGSLGVEAMIELLKVYAITHNLEKGFVNPRFFAPETAVSWKYRGQITPDNKTMSVDAHIKSIEDRDGQRVIVADANLAKDNLRIYQVTDIILAIVEA